MICFSFQGPGGDGMGMFQLRTQKHPVVFLVRRIWEGTLLTCTNFLGGGCHRIQQKTGGILKDSSKHQT